MTTRRLFLKGLSVLPLIGEAAARELSSAGISPFPSNSSKVVDVYNQNHKTFLFKTFKEWMKETGDDDIQEEAKDVSYLDPDLVSMKLPLTTKVRIQRRRNYKNILKRRKGWFDKILERTPEGVSWTFD